jgi:dTDP-4-amino-4,6-dideoxygalactose transaminase
LDPIQAAVLRVKLKYLDDWNARRTDIAARYQAALAGTAFILPAVPEQADPVWHLYVIRTSQREALRRHLTESGIGSLCHYPIPPHLQRAYADLGYKAGDFPIAETMANEVLSLPIGPHLAESQVNLAAGHVLEFTC